MKHPDPTLSNFIVMETAKEKKCWFQRRHLVVLVLALHFSALWRYMEDPSKTIPAFPPFSLHPGKPGRLEVCFFFLFQMIPFLFPVIIIFPVPVTFLLLLQEGWRGGICSAPLPDLLYQHGRLSPRHWASTGQAETKELETGGRSMMGVKNHHMKIKVFSCSLQDRFLPFSAALRTKDLDASKGTGTSMLHQGF